MNSNRSYKRVTSIFIKNSIRRLYLCTQLDLNPMRSISQLTNRTIIYQWINKIDEENPCYQLFGKIFSDNLNLQKKYILNNFGDIDPILKQYWYESIDELNIDMSKSLNEQIAENLREQLRCLIGIL